LWLHSLKVAQLLRSAAALHTNQSRSYLNHLVLYSLRKRNFSRYECKDAVGLRLTSPAVIQAVFRLATGHSFHLGKLKLIVSLSAALCTFYSTVSQQHICTYLLFTVPFLGRSWSRQYATSQKDAGSNPDSVFGIFH